MAAVLKCPKCGKTFDCNPDGDCWCKAFPMVKIPENLKSDLCLCSCVLDELKKEQAPESE